MAEAHSLDIDVSSPTSVGTVPLKELYSRTLRDREAREGEPSGTHTHTIHTPQTRRRWRPKPDPLERQRATPHSYPPLTSNKHI